jgi:hypothetical protein
MKNIKCVILGVSTPMPLAYARVQPRGGRDDGQVLGWAGRIDCVGEFGTTDEEKETTCPCSLICVRWLFLVTPTVSRPSKRVTSGELTYSLMVKRVVAPSSH